MGKKYKIKSINLVCLSFQDVSMYLFYGTGLKSLILQYLCNHTPYECFVCFSTKFKSPSSKQHLHFGKGVEDLCDLVSKILQNRRFERSLFTWRDPAP